METRRCRGANNNGGGIPVQESKDIWCRKLSLGRDWDRRRNKGSTSMLILCKCAGTRRCRWSLLAFRLKNKLRAADSRPPSRRSLFRSPNENIRYRVYDYARACVCVYMRTYTLPSPRSGSPDEITNAPPSPRTGYAGTATAAVAPHRKRKIFRN